MVLHDWQRGRLPFYAIPPEPPKEAGPEKKPDFLVPGALENMEDGMQHEHEFNAADDEVLEEAADQVEEEAEEEDVSWEKLFGGGDDSDDEDDADAALEVAKVKESLEKDGILGEHEDGEEDGDISGLEDADDAELVDMEEDESEEEDVPEPVPDKDARKPKNKNKRRESKGKKDDPNRQNDPDTIDDEFALVAKQKAKKKERKKAPCSGRKKKRICQ